MQAGPLILVAIWEGPWDGRVRDVAATPPIVSATCSTVSPPMLPAAPPPTTSRNTP